MIFYAVPYDKLVAPVCPEAKLRKLVKNMIYVGVVAQLLDIDMTEVEKAIRKQFAKKVKAANLNLGSRASWIRLRRCEPDQAAIRFASSAWTRPQAKSSSTATPPPLWDACLPGVTVVTWYPITPSSSLVEDTDRLHEDATASGRTARPPSPSCRRKTNWPPSAWWSAQAGRARAP